MEILVLIPVVIGLPILTLASVGGLAKILEFLVFQKMFSLKLALRIQMDAITAMKMIALAAIPSLDAPVANHARAAAFVTSSGFLVRAAAFFSWVDTESVLGSQAGFDKCIAAS